MRHLLSNESGLELCIINYNTGETCGCDEPHAGMEIVQVKLYGGFLRNKRVFLLNS